jgi:hypothetical protein
MEIKSGDYKDNGDKTKIETVFEKCNSKVKSFYARLRYH